MDYHYHKNFCWGTFCFLTGINSLLNLLAGSHSCHTGFSSEVQHHPLYYTFLKVKGELGPYQPWGESFICTALKYSEQEKPHQISSTLFRHHRIKTQNWPAAISFSKLFEKVRPAENLSHHSKHFSVFNNSCSTDVNETMNGARGRRGASW